MSPARLRPFLVALFLLLPLPACAAFVLTNQAVNMRAGPDPAFPLVTWIPARSTVNVAGCTVDRQWCDVVLGRRRGWVHARYLVLQARDAVPTVTFSVGEYWDAHYRSRPWFADRSNWVNWGTPSFQPPPQRAR